MSSFQHEYHARNSGVKRQPCAWGTNNQPSQAASMQAHPLLMVRRRRWWHRRASRQLQAGQRVETTACSAACLGPVVRRPHARLQVFCVDFGGLVWWLASPCAWLVREAGHVGGERSASGRKSYPDARHRLRMPPPQHAHNSPGHALIAVSAATLHAEPPTRPAAAPNRELEPE
jgi:hypothetical protein